MLAVFDFDHTIVDGNSDLVARDIIEPHDLIPNRKDYHNNWTQYMQQVFNVLKNIKISAEQVVDAVSLMNSIQGMPKLMRALKKSNIDIIVASDSNTLFIHYWLKFNKLSDIVSCVFTNPAKIEDGLIEIKPYTEQTTCNQCQKNMCKGLIVKEYVSKTDNKFNKIFYFGDGSNDLCPVLKLTQNDIAFPRLGYALENLLKSHITQAKVIPWCTGEDAYEYLKSSKLISISNNEDY